MKHYIVLIASSDSRIKHGHVVEHPEAATAKQPLQQQLPLDLLTVDLVCQPWYVVGQLVLQRKCSKASPKVTMMMSEHWHPRELLVPVCGMVSHNLLRRLVKALKIDSPTALSIDRFTCSGACTLTILKKLRTARVPKWLWIIFFGFNMVQGLPRYCHPEAEEDKADGPWMP